VGNRAVFFGVGAVNEKRRLVRVRRRSEPIPMMEGVSGNRQPDNVRASRLFPASGHPAAT
jgi:hypothetical protein